jgi:hypothetical protein
MGIKMLGVANGKRPRSRNVLLMIVMTATVLALVPGEALAAAPRPLPTGAHTVVAAPMEPTPRVGIQSASSQPYPVTRATQRYWPMYSPDTTMYEAAAAAGCTVIGYLGPIGVAIAAGCAGAIVLASKVSGKQGGWWRDSVFQTAQAIVHIGEVCTMSLSCWIQNTDIYLKTGNSVLDTAAALYLFTYGPALNGALQVVYCPRMWWAGPFEWIRILNGQGV